MLKVQEMNFADFVELLSFCNPPPDKSGNITVWKRHTGLLAEAETTTTAADKLRKTYVLFVLLHCSFIENFKDKKTPSKTYVHWC